MIEKNGYSVAPIERATSASFLGSFEQLRLRSLVVVTWALVIASPSLFLKPSGDDWGTMTPLWSSLPDLVRPYANGAHLWRPLEAMLIRRVMGEFGFLYPWYPHAVTIVGHALAGVLVFLCSHYAGASTRASTWAALVFAAAPGVCAAMWSMDSAIQTMSTAFGLAACLAYLASHPGSLGWALLATGALLWKESGAAWLVGAPLLGIVAAKGGPIGPVTIRAVRNSFLGLGILGIYFLVRFALSGSVQLGGAEGGYSLHLAPWTVFRNLAQLIAISASTIDSVALFSRERGWVWMFAGSTALCLPMLFTVAIKLRHVSRSEALVSAAFVLIVCSPHLLLTHVSEMYAHPIAAAIVIVVAVGVRDAKIGYLPVVMWMTGSFLVGAHKFSEMFTSGETASATIAEMKATLATSTPPEHICLVRGVPGPGNYSVFRMDPAVASYWGLAIPSVWGFRPVRKVSRVWHDSECPETSDVGWHVYPNGSVSRVK